jgi:hypothetical protein
MWVGWRQVGRRIGMPGKPGGDRMCQDHWHLREIGVTSFCILDVLGYGRGDVRL